MGQGLGKNSPVVLNLGKANYDAMISRHGQWVRWRTCRPCACTVRETMQPDLHCPECGGTGRIYGFQRDREVCVTVMVRDGGCVAGLPEEYAASSLLTAYSPLSGKDMPCEKHGAFLVFRSPPGKGEYITAVLSESLVKRKERVTLERLPGGFWRVPGLKTERERLDELWYTAPGDIVSVGEVVWEGGTLEVRELRQDMIYAPLPEGKETQAPVTACGVQYIMPQKFAVLSQNLTKSDAEWADTARGEAVLVFPWNCDVAEDDVITVLSGTVTEKEVKVRSADDADVLGAFFVSDIVSVAGRREFSAVRGDYALTGTNRLLWLCPDAPEPGEGYSVVYRTNPTYSVRKSIPQIRTSENQRMPKKAVVSLLGAFKEGLRVNVQ